MPNIENSSWARLSDLLSRNARVWTRTWRAPGNDLATGWRAIQVIQAPDPWHTNRLECVSAPGGRKGNAMRVEVDDGDVAWNPHANNGAGAPIPSGYRAEVVGPEEHASKLPVRYRWTTWFDASYPQ